MRGLTGFLCPILSVMFAALSGSAVAQAAPDFTQGDAMLSLLRSCHDGKASAADVDHVMGFPGTDLVVGQQNISRRVTKDQYRTVLQAACAGKVADVKPVEPGARAEKGVAGLVQDVGPSLVWGRDHFGELEASLRNLRGNQAIGEAIPLAGKYLPQSITLNPKLYVVMGGRAGAAAIEDQLYFDVLITEWRSSRGTSKPVSAGDVVEFFAHETHHLGYGQILDQKRTSLRLTPAEAQAWDFLLATMMEGSALLLINGHEKLADLEQQPDTKVYLARVPELLPAMQKVLQRALSGPISKEEYAEAVEPFLDMGYHATGAILLAAIEKKRGLKGVLEVMDDPRQLLFVYNDCAESSSVPFRFDPALAKQLAHLGDSASR